MILPDINQFIIEDKHVKLNLAGIHGENEREERKELTNFLFQFSVK